MTDEFDIHRQEFESDSDMERALRPLRSDFNGQEKVIENPYFVQAARFVVNHLTTHCIVATGLGKTTLLTIAK